MNNLANIVKGALSKRKKPTLARLGMILYILGFIIMLVGFESGFLIPGFLLTFAGIGVAITGLGKGERGSLISFSGGLASELRSLAERLEDEHRISGDGYGHLVIAVEKAKKQELISQESKRRILTALDRLVLKKGHRISGSDYVELEKRLLATEERKTNDDGTEELFFKWQIKKILDDYEKLREQIRDKRLEV